MDKDQEKEQLKKKLTPEEYHVTQEKGTEVPYSGKYHNEKADGTYKCKWLSRREIENAGKIFLAMLSVKNWKTKHQIK